MLSFLNLTLFCLISRLVKGYVQNSEQSYLDNFQTLINDSYSESLPSHLLNTCKNSEIFNKQNVQNKSITIGSITSEQVQKICSNNTICIIETGVIVTMNSNLNLAALVLKGILNWNDSNQILADQWLCAGYVAVNGGQLNMNLIEKKGYIYIKNNNLKHENLSYRALGAYNKGRINIIGRSLNRTWSLLAKKIAKPVSSISLMHDPKQMGWKIGDRIALAPTDITMGGSEGTGESFFIGGFDSNNTIYLVDKKGLKVTTTKAYFSQSKYGSQDMYAIVAAEVINLSRNILITGDDFTHVIGNNSTLPSGNVEFDAVQASECTSIAWMKRTKCTLGLHVIAKSEGSVLSLQYVRIEKCGQRGVLGKYCTHFHLVKACPDCKMIGNAYEYGMSRGTVIHGTHLTTVEHNVYYDVRGVSIYIEDGNELYNKIQYNVGICPWSLTGPKQGCTIPGTDNDADTSINMAGFWSSGFRNYVIGNRFSNYFNGLLFSDEFSKGRQLLNGLMCGNRQRFGRIEGNTLHQCGRFGTYVVVNIYPENVQVSIESDGIPVNKKTDCRSWLPDGTDNGWPTMIKNNVDYGNTFVGQYGAGDIQYKNHMSFTNGDLIYWKETKNFQDTCSAHLSDSYFEAGNMALPGGHGTFLIENAIFKNSISFESSHHCNEGGATGISCMPTYLFVNMNWIGDTPKASILWHATTPPVKPQAGGMFTLAPDDPLNGNYLFPKGIRSIIHPYWEYLLYLDNNTTCFTNDQLNQSKQNYRLYNQPYGAILCKKSVRRLEIWSFGNDTRNMTLELYQNEKLVSSVNLTRYIIGTMSSRQGYSATVIPGLTQKYKLKMASGNENIPKDWIIEFSDLIFASRWSKDEIILEVAGRNCPPIVDSQHDRRFIWPRDESWLNRTGRGACSIYPDMPVVNCKSQMKLTNIEQCAICKGIKCNNGNCDCGSGLCLCEPGFAGSNCEINTCSISNCVNGVCASKYLGGRLSATLKQCVCQDGWYGEKCDSRIIQSIQDDSTLFPCDNKCKGSYPYGCDKNAKWGYCLTSGGCYYAKNNNSNACCYRGCTSSYPVSIADDSS